MTVYQKYGVIGLATAFAILQKLKHQIFRLFIIYNGCHGVKRYTNLTSSENTSDIFFENEHATTFIFKSLLINNGVSIVPCIFFAAWSDKHGRKLLLTLPFMGSLLSDVLMLILLFVPTVSKNWLLVSEAIHGLCGGTALIGVGCMCYITDSTDHRRRTWVIGLFIGLFSVLPIIEMVLQHYWSPLQIRLDWKTLVWIGIFIRMILSLYFLVYVRLLVVESVFVLGSYQGSPLASLLTPINVTDTVNCVFKRRMDNLRSYIVALCTAFIFYSVLLHGNVFVLPYHFHNVFNWSYWNILILLVILTGLQIVTLWGCSYSTIRCRVQDIDLSVYGGMSIAVSNLILVLTSHEWWAVIGIFVGFASLLAPTSVLSVLSKLVERNETGSLYAGIGFLMLSTQLVSASSFQALEKVCSEAGMPQVVFLLSFALATFGLLFLTYLKRKIAPDLLGHINGRESLALINKKGELEHVFNQYT